MDPSAAREVFEASQDLTVGIEEEWAIIDPVSLELKVKFAVVWLVGSAGFGVPIVTVGAAVSTVQL